MNDSENRSQNGFTFDTCVGIKICENPNLGGLLTCRVDFENSEIHLNSQTIFEATRLGFDINNVTNQIQNSIGAKIIHGYITAEMRNDADYLEGVCPTLHSGDSQILAYARATGTILVTCDRGLAEAARLSDTRVVNPDLLPCDKITKNTKSKLQKMIKKAITKPTIVKQKVNSLALKPGQKIVWRAFN